MALFTKCILKTKDVRDGRRFSVMSRHTLNDGTTPDQRITQDSFERHYPELAPSSKLIGDYYKRNLPWSEFEALFCEQIKSTSAQKILKEIALMSISENVTLLCIEDTPHFCHRRLLAEECARLVPEIIIEYY